MVRRNSLQAILEDSVEPVRADSEALGARRARKAPLPQPPPYLLCQIAPHEHYRSLGLRKADLEKDVLSDHDADREPQCGLRDSEFDRLILEKARRQDPRWRLFRGKEAQETRDREAEIPDTRLSPADVGADGDARETHAQSLHPSRDCFRPTPERMGLRNDGG